MRRNVGQTFLHLPDSLVHLGMVLLYTLNGVKTLLQSTHCPICHNEIRVFLLDEFDSLHLLLLQLSLLLELTIEFGCKICAYVHIIL